MDEEVKKALQEMLTEFKNGLPKGITKEELEKQVKDIETKISENESYKQYVDEVKTTLETAFKELETIVSKKGSEKTEVKTIADVLLQEWEAKGIKKASDLKKLPEFKEEYEFKAISATITTAQTGTIGRTEMVTSPTFPRLRALAFLPYMRTSFLSVGKSIIGWTTGAYTSQVGYIGENGTPATNDSATALEKTRGLAKISARQLITKEVEDDLPELARQMQEQMLLKINLFVDAEIYGGDGNPDTNANPTHIYGMKLHATAFDATDFAATVINANAADLIDAIKTKAKKVNYTIDRVWMNPTDAYTLKRTKDSSGQYVINQLITGESVIAGIQIIETEAVTAGTLFAADTFVMQLRIKQEMSFKVGQFGDDEIYDRYSAIMFARMQTLVEDEDRKGVYYVADIAADLDEISVVS